MSLEDIFNVSVSASTRTPTRTGFGTPLFACYHTRWGVSLDRVRSYASLTGMVSDGFLPTDPAYLMAAAAFAQNPSPTRVKIGLRALPPTQIVDATPAAPVSGSTAETYALKIDGLTATFTSDATPTLAEVCTGLAAAINALADVDAIIVAGVSTAGIQTLTGTSLDGAVGAAVMSPARVLTMTFSSHANWDATTAVVTGLDENGASLTENFSIPDAGNATVTGTKRFKRVTSIVIPAQSGTSGTFTVGTRAVVTATGASATKVVCTSVAGELHSYELTTANVTLQTQTADPGIATDMAAILLADPDWYGLALDSNSEAETNALAAWVESNKKLFIAQSADAGCLLAGTTTDVFSDLELNAYGRTSGWFHPSIGTAGSWLAAALLGAMLPTTPGSETWAFKTLAGVTAYTLTETQTAALEGKTANWYQPMGGVNVTYNGKVAGNEWIDIVRFLDRRRARQRERLYALQLASLKIPFTDRGISRIRAEIAADIKEGQRDGGFDPDATPTITVPLAADVSSEDKAARHLPGVTWSMDLAGAIHTMAVTGTATL